MQPKGRKLVQPLQAARPSMQLDETTADRSPVTKRNLSFQW